MVENKPNINEILSAPGEREAVADPSGRATPLNHRGKRSPPTERARRGTPPPPDGAISPRVGKKIKAKERETLFFQRKGGEGGEAGARSPGGAARGRGGCGGRPRSPSPDGAAPAAAPGVRGARLLPAPERPEGHGESPEPSPGGRGRAPGARRGAAGEREPRSPPRDSPFLPPPPGSSLK